MGPDLVDRARELLVEIASGREVTLAQIEGLAAGVLASPLVRLSQQVLDGGPHVMRRAIELAAAVCEGAGTGALQARRG